MVWILKLWLWYLEAGMKIFTILGLFEPRHEISNNVVCVTSKASDQPAQSRSLIRALASRLNIPWVLSYWPSIVLNRLHWLFWDRLYTCLYSTLLETTCHGSNCVVVAVCFCSSGHMSSSFSFSNEKLSLKFRGSTAILTRADDLGWGQGHRIRRTHFNVDFKRQCDLLFRDNSYFNCHHKIYTDVELY